MVYDNKNDNGPEESSDVKWLLIEVMNRMDLFLRPIEVSFFSPPLSLSLLLSSLMVRRTNRTEIYRRYFDNGKTYRYDLQGEDEGSEP